MKKNTFHLIVITLLLQLSVKLYSQNNTFPYNAPQHLIDNVSRQMESKYGSQCNFSKYFIMDSVIINSRNTDFTYAYLHEVFEDSYNNLSGLSIFTCQNYSPNIDRTIIGIIKDGEIVWDSGPIIYGTIENYFVFCKDINKDGIVDIGIVSDYSDSNPNNTVKYLWILSWDGSNAKFINEYDTFSGKSKLEPGYFNLYDQEGDGICEISSMYNYYDEYTHTPPENPPPNHPYVSYGWNGSKYGLWPDVYQMEEGDYYPAIWIKPIINCNVTFNEDENLFRFDFTIKNDTGSVQKISTIYFLNMSVQDIIPRKDPEANQLTNFYQSIVPNSWAFSSADNSYYGLIEPGDERTDGYWFEGNGLPGICNINIRGLIDVEFTRGSSDEELIESILENSVKKQTLGLKGIPDDLEPVEFLDTLISYTTQSYDLYWIETEETYNSLMDKLEKAKEHHINGNNSQSATELASLLTEVETQNGNQLTSEAYALLKYNTEYLLKHLNE